MSKQNQRKKKANTLIESKKSKKKKANTLTEKEKKKRKKSQHVNQKKKKKRANTLTEKEKIKEKKSTRWRWSPTWAVFLEAHFMSFPLLVFSLFLGENFLVGLRRKHFDPIIYFPSFSPNQIHFKKVFLPIISPKFFIHLISPSNKHILNVSHSSLLLMLLPPLITSIKAPFVLK